MIKKAKRQKNKKQNKKRSEIGLFFQIFKTEFADSWKKKNKRDQSEQTCLG